MEQLTDAQLHELARKRVDFRRHFIVYCIINSVLWLLWFLTGRGYVWPIWPMASWGVGLAFHYLFEYRSFKFLSDEKEFEKLKKMAQDQSQVN